jgi:hypothetical protein
MVPLTGEGNIKISCLQLEQHGRQICAVDHRAVRRMEIARDRHEPRCACALGRETTRSREGIPVNETVKELPEGSIFRAGDAGGSDLRSMQSFLT